MAIAIGSNIWVGPTSSVSSIALQLTNVDNPSLLVVNVQAYRLDDAWNFANTDVDDDVTVNGYTFDSSSVMSGAESCASGGYWGVASYSRQNTNTGTINITWNPVNTDTVWANASAYEVTGAATSSAYDIGAKATGTSKTPSSGAFSLTTTGCLLGIWGNYCSANVTGHSVTGDLATSTGYQGNCDYNVGGGGYANSVASGNRTASFSLTSTASNLWICGGFAYKAAAGGPYASAQAGALPAQSGALARLAEYKRSTLAGSI